MSQIVEPDIRRQTSVDHCGLEVTQHEVVVPDRTTLGGTEHVTAPCGVPADVVAEELAQEAGEWHHPTPA
jgi:hypothetical protein